MARLKVRLFGSFQVHLNEANITKFESNKVRALLAYLMVENQEAHRREKLTTLFWPEMPTKRANSNLSQALYSLRHLLQDYHANPPYFLRSRDSIQFNRASEYWLDVEHFNQNLVRNQALVASKDGYHENLLRAVEHYRGDFLEGISFDSSLTFDEWVCVQRQRYQRQVLDSLYQLATHYRERNQLSKALSYAWRQVELDPLDERACRQLMQFLATNDQRSQALTQFERLQVILAEELGVTPEPETLALRDEIRNQNRDPIQAKVGTGNLPVFITSLIGRQKELKELQDLMENEDCRLLTIIGPGGSGKTRLALEVSRISQPLFTHGVYWVPLNPVQSPESILPAIAEAVELSRGEGSDIQVQLGNYLREKNILLLLDGFEHLLDGTHLLAEILHQTNELKILVTSRARLNLKGEYLYLLGGMGYPNSEAPEAEILASDAVRMLINGLQRTRPHYEPALEEIQYLYQICQKVQGMPLGILLAASWGAVLSLEEIADRVGRSLDFLSANWTDIPARQRSMRATFDHTWNLLDEHEQNFFQSLSVFRGAFTRRAAREVSGASHHELRALVERSLLWYKTPGWYEMHELLRQYGREKLAQSARVEQEICHRHSHYFLGQLARLGEELKTAQQVGALNHIDLEHENCRAAWNWAATQGKFEYVESALEGLCRYYELRTRYAEGESACQIAIGKLEETQPAKDYWLLLSRLRICASRFNHLLERFDQAQNEIDRAKDIIEKAEAVGLDTRWERAVFFFEMGEMAANREPEAAQGKYQQGLRLFQELGDPWQIAMIQLTVAENAAIALYGDVMAATPLLSECFDTFQEWGDTRGMARSLYSLSMVNVRLGMFDQALKQIDEAVNLYRSIGDQANMAASLSGLATIFQWTGRFYDTSDLLLRCLPIYQELGDSYQITYIHFVLSTSYLQSGDYQAARFYALRCLELACENGFQLGLITPHMTLHCLDLVEQNYAAAKEHAEKCIIGLRKLHNQVELGAALLSLWYVEYHSGDKNHSWDSFFEALQIGIGIQSVFMIHNAAFEISSFYLDVGETELAVEFIALAKCHPAIANSRWVWDVFEQPVVEAAKALPPEVVTAAQQRGRQRDIWETARELLAEFSREPG